MTTATITFEKTMNVKIRNMDGTENPTIWTVDQVEGEILHLTDSADAEVKRQVHQTLVTASIDGEGNETENEEHVTELKAEDRISVDDLKAKKKKKAARKPKVPFNFEEEAKNGEIWTRHREDGKFPHDHVVVKSHVQIFSDEKSYRTFNTYDGSVSRKGKGIHSYDFTEKMTPQKKRRQLERKGYVHEFGIIPPQPEVEEKPKKAKKKAEPKTETSESKSSEVKPTMTLTEKPGIKVTDVTPGIKLISAEYKALKNGFSEIEITVSVDGENHTGMASFEHDGRDLELEYFSSEIHDRLQDDGYEFLYTDEATEMLAPELKKGQAAYDAIVASAA